MNPSKSLSLAVITFAFLTGCGDKPESKPSASIPAPPPAPTPLITVYTKTPDTKGLDPSTNFYAIVSLPTEAEQKAGLDAIMAEFKKAANANPQGKAILRTVDDVIGRLNDAGLCDISKGELSSVTLGMTLPGTNRELEQSTEADEIDFTIILRGKFNPGRTKAFCEAEGVKGTLIDGQPAWELQSIISKLSPKAQTEKPEPGKEEWISYADEGTLLIGNRNSLRKSIGAFKGQSPSLRPTRVKAADMMGNWNIYVSFSNSALLDDLVKASSDADERRMISVLPREQILFVAGMKSGNALGTVIMTDASGQETIQYTSSVSQSLIPKLINAYTPSSARR
jgi:hypothetical protein